MIPKELLPLLAQAENDENRVTLDGAEKLSTLLYVLTEAEMDDIYPLYPGVLLKVHAQLSQHYRVGDRPEHLDVVIASLSRCAAIESFDNEDEQSLESDPSSASVTPREGHDPQINSQAVSIPDRMLHRYMTLLFNACMNSIAAVGEKQPELKTEISAAMVELDHVKDCIGQEINYMIVNTIRGLKDTHTPQIADEIQRLQTRAHKVQDNNAILKLKIQLTDLMQEKEFRDIFSKNPEAKLALQTTILDAIVPEQITKALKTFSRAIQWHQFSDNLRKFSFLTSGASESKKPLQDFLKDATVSIENYVSLQGEVKNSTLG